MMSDLLSSDTDIALKYIGSVLGTLANHYDEISLERKCEDCKVPMLKKLFNIGDTGRCQHSIKILESDNNQEKNLEEK